MRNIILLGSTTNNTLLIWVTQDPHGPWCSKKIEAIQFRVGEGLGFEGLGELSRKCANNLQHDGSGLCSDYSMDTVPHSYYARGRPWELDHRGNGFVAHLISDCC